MPAVLTPCRTIPPRTPLETLREADRRADPRPTFATVPHKIDYLFAGRLRPLAAAVARTPYSDHRMYLGVFG
jgi:hypothetical protein